MSATTGRLIARVLCDNWRGCTHADEEGYIRAAANSEPVRQTTAAESARYGCPEGVGVYVYSDGYSHTKITIYEKIDEDVSAGRYL